MGLNEPFHALLTLAQDRQSRSNTEELVRHHLNLWLSLDLTADELLQQT
jgi:hypothetical protein